jgi:hypothetical protein
MFRKTFVGAALALVVSLGTATQAHAAPVVLTPDYNFVTAGNGFSMTDSTHYTLNVATASGDQLSVQSIMGGAFTPVSNGLIQEAVNGTTGSLILNNGGETGGTMQASLINSQITPSGFSGLDIFSEWRVTSSNLTGFFVGQLVGTDAFAFNLTTNPDGSQSGQVKGDVAPIVPEPASMTLLLLGLGGLAARTRRKLLG